MGRRGRRRKKLPYHRK